MWCWSISTTVSCKCAYSSCGRKSGRQNDVKKLHRVDVRILSDSILASPALAVVSRLVITGGTHHRLHEELTVSGGYFRGDVFARERPASRRSTSGSTTASPHSGRRRFVLYTRSCQFAAHEDTILRTVEARSSERLRNLQNTLQTRKRQEIENITAVLDELTRAIEEELIIGVEAGTARTVHGCRTDAASP